MCFHVTASKLQIYKVNFTTASNQLKAFGHREQCGKTQVSKKVISKERFDT